ncbi:hypothetical protein [Bacillus massilinigeriensis]|nr:hypothetical protein [Bacillus massilionigeriensis]
MLKLEEIEFKKVKEKWLEKGVVLSDEEVRRLFGLGETNAKEFKLPNREK